MLQRVRFGEILGAAGTGGLCTQQQEGVFAGSGAAAGRAGEQCVCKTVNPRLVGEYTCFCLV